MFTEHTLHSQDTVRRTQFWNLPHLPLEPSLPWVWFGNYYIALKSNPKRILNSLHAKLQQFGVFRWVSANSQKDNKVLPILTDAMIIWKPKDSGVSLLGKVHGVCTGVWMCVRACLLITTLIFNALSQCTGGAAMVNYAIVKKKSNSLLTQYRLFQYIIVPLTFIWSPASPFPQCL